MKAQSSLLTQVHTGHIGLRDYLISRGVPDVTTPWCPCGLDKETPHHTIYRGEDEGMMEEAGERPAAMLLFAPVNYATGWGEAKWATKVDPDETIALYD